MMDSTPNPVEPCHQLTRLTEDLKGWQYCELPEGHDGPCNDAPAVEPEQPTCPFGHTWSHNAAHPHWHGDHSKCDPAARDTTPSPDTLRRSVTHPNRIIAPAVESVANSGTEALQTPGPAVEPETTLYPDGGEQSRKESHTTTYSTPETRFYAETGTARTEVTNEVRWHADIVNEARKLRDHHHFHYGHPTPDSPYGQFFALLGHREAQP